MKKNSRELSYINRGSEVYLKHCHAYHEVERLGIVTCLNLHSKYLKLDDENVLFGDIYEIRVVD